MRKHFTNCSFRKNLLNERVISKQDSSLQAQHYFITSYVCSTQHCRTEEKWGWTYRVSPVIFIITAATSSLASLWALVAWLLTSFCLKLLLVLRGNIHNLEIGTKTVIWRVNSVAKCLKLACLNEDWMSSYSKLNRIWKLDWDFLLTRIILRRRGLKIANLSALGEMTKDVRCREEWDF